MVTEWVTTRTPGILKREFERRGQVEIRYRARYRDTTGKSRSRNLARLRDAERFLSDTRSKLANGTPPDVAAGKATLAAFAEHFMNTSSHLRPKSRELYEGWLHVPPVLGDCKLSNIAKADVRRSRHRL